MQTNRITTIIISIVTAGNMVEQPLLFLRILEPVLERRAVMVLELDCSTRRIVTRLNLVGLERPMAEKKESCRKECGTADW